MFRGTEACRLLGKGVSLARLEQEAWLMKEFRCFLQALTLLAGRTRRCSAAPCA